MSEKIRPLGNCRYTSHMPLEHRHILVVDVWKTAWFEEDADTKIAEEWYHLDSTSGYKAAQEVLGLLISGRIRNHEDPRVGIRNARIICEKTLKPPTTGGEQYIGKSHE